MSASTIVNDMSLQFATVNGSGSQSANNIITKALFRMGIPVGSKNVFPSNIQGLPTWYTIRVNSKGYRAPKKALDWVVCMNAQTLEEDILSVAPGGVVLYNTDIAPKDFQPKRDDVSFYPVPFTALAREKVSQVKLRKLLVNIMYVGVLAQLLEIDCEVVEAVIADTFSTKPKVIEANVEAFRGGFEYAKENIKKSDPYKVEKMGENKGLFLTDGNNLAALGALMGGCTVLAWYPITPSSSLCESLISYFHRYRKDKDGKNLFAAIQAEDELASLGMVLGAGWSGARSMTATAGPGMSLMSEFAGLSYFAEIPAVLVNVQRMGPSTGLPTRTSQGDLRSAFTLSHGDAKHVNLIPGTPTEAFEFARISFDLAEELQTLIIILMDLDLGMNIWSCDPLDYPTDAFKRGRVLDAEGLEKMKDWGRYKDVKGDGIPYRTLPGTDHPRAAYFTRGTGHTDDATYSEKPADWKSNIDRLDRKWETARTMVPQSIVQEDGNEVGIIAYGSSDLCMKEALDKLNEEGLKCDYLRIRAFPFHQDVLKFVKNHKRLYVIDQNRDAQMYEFLENHVAEGPLVDRLRSIRHYDGTPLDAQTVFEGVVAGEKNKNQSTRQVLEGQKNA